MIVLLGSIALASSFPVSVSAQATWHASADPTLVIGSTDGPPEEAFHEVTGAIRGPGGVVVIANAGSGELRVFSPSGTFLRSFGRPGDGPREFGSIAWIDRCGGESIVAYDSRRYRITKWDVSGSLLEEFTIQGPTEDLPPYRVRCGRSGKFVVVGWPDVMGISQQRGSYRPNAGIALVNEQGQLERVIGQFPAQERIRTANNDRPHPFGRSTSVGIDEDGVYIGTADSFSVVYVSSSGTRRTFGRDRAIAPLSQEQRARWVDQYLERAPIAQRPRLRRDLLASEDVPAAAPAYSDLMLDAQGFVWVAPYVIGSDSPTVEWSVFDNAGTFVATIQLPHAFRPLEIGDTYLLGVGRGALDVERVYQYSLSRADR